MANGIEDILPDTSFINVASDYINEGGAVPAPNQSPIDMIIEMTAPSVTEIANDLGIPVSNEDTKVIAKGIAEGNPGIALDVVNAKLTNLPNETKARLAGELISKAGMITTPAGKLNAINATLQTGGDYVQNALDFASSRLDPDSMGANILGTTSNIIEGGQGIFGGATNDLNRTMANIVYDPIYGFVNLAGRNVIDPFFNLTGFGSNLFRKKDKPDPVQLTNDQINQIVEDEVNLNPSPPVFTPPPATSNEAEVAYGGQQVDPGGGGSGGSYGGGEDFGSPFKPSRPSGPDLRFRANGGLVAVSRYLKGR